MPNHPTYLRHTGNGRIFNWTEQLAKREDMKPYFGEDDGLIEDPIELDLESAKAKLEAEQAVKPQMPRLQPRPKPEAAPDPEAPPTSAFSEDLSSLSWQKLKALVESRGGTYTSRGDAIAMLSTAK